MICKNRQSAYSRLDEFEANYYALLEESGVEEWEDAGSLVHNFYVKYFDENGRINSIFC